MRLAEMVRKASRVFLIGNGGSAANAIHIANDWIACGVDARALPADVATLTAIGNDFGYEFVFSRQLAHMAKPGDLVIALSGSGNSPNIVNALITVREKQATSVLITGNWLHECAAQDFADVVIKYGDNMQAAEEQQLFWGHEVMRELSK